MAAGATTPIFMSTSMRSIKNGTFSRISRRDRLNRVRLARQALLLEDGLLRCRSICLRDEGTIQILEASLSTNSEPSSRLLMRTAFRAAARKLIAFFSRANPQLDQHNSKIDSGSCSSTTGVGSRRLTPEFGICSRVCAAWWGFDTMRGRAEVDRLRPWTRVCCRRRRSPPTTVVSLGREGVSRAGFHSTPLRLFVELSRRRIDSFVEQPVHLGLLATIPVAFPSLVSDRTRRSCPLVGVTPIK